VYDARTSASNANTSHEARLIIGATDIIDANSSGI